MTGAGKENLSKTIISGSTSRGLGEQEQEFTYVVEPSAERHTPGFLWHAVTRKKYPTPPPGTVVQLTRAVPEPAPESLALNEAQANVCAPLV
jgi:hypothetical protein